MNFLSHFHFYRSEDPYYNVGLVLPDLARNFSKTHLRPLAHYEDPVHVALGRGSRDHIEGDRIFHQSRFFRTCEDYISSLLDGQAAWPRKWFMNHLLLEISLDRALMDLDPNLCADFYHQLEQADTDKLTSFLRLSGTGDFASFSESYKRFVSYRFIFDYEHNEKIFFALSRVYSRTGIIYDWKGEDKDLLLLHLPGILEFINKHIDSLQKELKQNEQNSEKNE